MFLSDVVTNEGLSGVKSKAYFDAIFKGDLDFDFDEATQRITILSPYRNMQFEKLEVKEINQEKKILVTFKGSQGQSQGVTYFINDFTGLNTSDEKEKKKAAAIGLSIINLLKAFKGDNLSAEEKQQIGGKDITALAKSLDDFLQRIKNHARVHVMVTFKEASSEYINFTIPSKDREEKYVTSIISAKSNPQDVSKLNPTAMSMVVLSKEGSTSGKANTPNLNTLSSDEDLPF